MQQKMPDFYFMRISMTKQNWGKRAKNSRKCFIHATSIVLRHLQTTSSRDNVVRYAAASISMMKTEVKKYLKHCRDLHSTIVTLIKKAIT